MHKKYSQWGTFSLIILVPLFIVSLVFLVRSVLKQSGETGLFLVLSFVFLSCILTFYKLTIELRPQYVSFSMGVGWIGKKYVWHQIERCEVKQNKWTEGIGIRMLRNGWLYNVSGMYSVALYFANSKKVIRIGTDKPHEVCKAIEAHLENPQIGIETHDRESRVWFTPIWIILVLAMLTVVVLPSLQDNKITLKEEAIEIKGFYGLQIMYDEIAQIEEVKKLPLIGRRTNGYSFRNTKVGNFELERGDKVKLFIKTNALPYVYLQTVDGDKVYFNFEDSHKTISLILALQERVDFEPREE